MSAVAVLFARTDSVYHTLPGLDVYDIDRDALNWPGGCPGIFHPPCRSWGRLRNFAKPREFERAAGVWAVDQVREWGGVLEHPAQSTLWLYRAMPAPGETDAFGGWTLPILQSWFGHRADKATWLYIVGRGRRDMATMPMVLGRAPCSVASRLSTDRSSPGYRPEISKAEREHTPIELARWLVDLARSCRSPIGAVMEAA